MLAAIFVMNAEVVALVAFDTTAQVVATLEAGSDPEGVHGVVVVGNPEDRKFLGKTKEYEVITPGKPAQFADICSGSDDFESFQNLCRVT